MGQTEQGLTDMEEARNEKATEKHNVIDDAIAERGEGYTVFSIVRPFSTDRYPFSFRNSPLELCTDRLRRS
jgi:translation elongation factor EF-1alpha